MRRKTTRRPRTISLGWRPGHRHWAGAGQALVKLVLLQQLLLQQQLLTALLPLLPSALPSPLLPGLPSGHCRRWGEARSLSVVSHYTRKFHPDDKNSLAVEVHESKRNLADEDPPKASVPLAIPLLTSPLLPPTLTMVTPALLFLPESSGFFSCGLKPPMSLCIF